MSAWKYKQVMPKVLVSRLQLVQTKDMLDLIGRPLDQTHSQLTKTPYRRELSEIPPQQITSISLEDALLRNFVRTIDEIARYSPKGVGALLSTTLMKFEASNVKTVLRAKSAGLDADEAMRCIIPAGRLNATKCMEIMKNSGSVHDVLKLLSESEYGRALKGALEEYEKTGMLFPVEVAVDRYVYSRIWKAAKKLRGLDGRIARTLFGLEIDSMNIRVLLRSRELGVSRDQALQYLIPVSDVFGREEFDEIMQAGEARSMIGRLLEVAMANLARDYEYLLTELIREYDAHKSLSRLETVLDRELLKASLRMLKRYTPFFNIGFILAFLNLKWFELRNLRTLIRGAEEGISSARMKELLILPS